MRAFVPLLLEGQHTQRIKLACQDLARRIKSATHGGKVMATISSRGLAFSLLASAISIMGTPFVRAAQPQNPPPTVVPLTNVFTAVQGVEPRVASSSGNVIQFGTSESLREKAERLKDPQQRAEVRIEERARLAELYRDLREVLELDDATEEKVLELLTDQQMERLDQMFLGDQEAARRQLWKGLTQAQAETQTKYIQALREVLGQEKLERYQTFERTLGERSRVAKLNDRLAPADKLQAEQKERLVALYQDDMARYLAKSRLNRPSFAPFGTALGTTLPSPEEMQRQSQLLTITHNEQNWRRMPESHRLLRERAAGILTPLQLKALQQMQEEEASNLQQWIEQARLDAGLSAEIPAEPEATVVTEAPARMPIAGEVKFRIKLTVNRNQPDRFTHVGGNGVPVTFECAEGLLMEVTPTVYDDDTFNLDMAYYEVSSTGKRRIGQSGTMGTIDRVRPATPGLEFSGSGGTVLTGNKGYAIEVSALIEPV
jgi:hypothetical protein